MNDQLDCALDLMRRLPPQQITKNLCDLVDLVLTQNSWWLCIQYVKLLYCCYDLRLSSLRFLSRYFRIIVSYIYRDNSCAWRYICVALLHCKHDRFTTSLLKFQHALLHAAAYREWRSACDCATLGEQCLCLHEIPPQLLLKLCHRWS